MIRFLFDERMEEGERKGGREERKGRRKEEEKSNGEGKGEELMF